MLYDFIYERNVRNELNFHWYAKFTHDDDDCFKRKYATVLSLPSSSSFIPRHTISTTATAFLLLTPRKVDKKSPSLRIKKGEKSGKTGGKVEERREKNVTVILYCLRYLSS